MTDKMEPDKADDNEELDAEALALARCYALARKRARQMREQRARLAPAQPPTPPAARAE